MSQTAFRSLACPCGCQIVPNKVLRRLAEEADLSEQVRRQMVDTALVDLEVRKLRAQALQLARVSGAIAPVAAMALAPAPSVTVYDCQHGQTLPGAPIGHPEDSADASARRTFTETRAVADFYKQVFNRNSIDGAGMTLLSSIHFGSGYNNAQWNGAQMIYGDGDGSIFLDFTLGNDVIGHELTHGVTQHTLQLVYANESGGLNESLSDVFGSMFRQWRAGQAVTAADWLIGKDIMGPAALAKGYTCLRDMANPAGAHCLAPQISHYRDYQPGMDPHESSGVANFAFYTAAIAIGGHSWDRLGQVWYKAMTGNGAKPNLKMAAFANLTRQAAGALFPTDVAAIDQAWKQVGL